MASRRFIAVAVAVALMTLAGCGGPDDGSGGGGSGGGGSSDRSSSRVPSESGGDVPSPPPSTVASHKTPDSECPENWHGLTVHTDKQAEVEYVSAIAACTLDGSGVWLRNDSTVVFTIRFPAGIGPPTWIHEAEGGSLFRSLLPVKESTAVAMPRDQLWLKTRPASVSIEPTIGHSLAWETFTITRAELQSRGEQWVAEDLARRGTGRSAIALCTLSGYQIGSAAEETLEELDTQKLLTEAMGAGIAVNQCRQVSQTITGPAGPSDDLASSISRQLKNPAVLEGAHTRMVWAQRLQRVLSVL